MLIAITAFLFVRAVGHQLIQTDEMFGDCAGLPVG